ncbi:uncharacterized protein LOC115584549 isoform X2 [Sparus aurata]|uniref:uncharacterized protein LOC115584549 isoform X2 n=1 Tax=Sparus aurata TaxID=8175 RepID=UPI0011C14B5F|nr:homeodomain-interacting protein kinase 1 isoform X2 [Sparus aurata]
MRGSIQLNLSQVYRQIFWLIRRGEMNSNTAEQKPWDGSNCYVPSKGQKVSERKMSADESCSTNAQMKLDLPDTYELLECLGEGCFGVVAKCQKVDTGQIVAIKFPFGRENDNEVSMLRSIKSKIDKHDNIIEFIDSFPTRCGTALVFEQLDIDLHEYLAKLDERLPLADIRSITQQIATALDALKGIRVIHGDLHLGNIMMVNHQTQPLKVKLIDFGGSILRTEETLERIMQPLHIWSPEVALGLPFTEAIDMWALGCVLFEMLFGQRPVNGHCPYEIIRSIINIRGMPEDHLIDNSPLAEFYFNRTESNTWKFKTPAEFIRDSCMGDDNNCKIGESYKIVPVDFDDEYEPCLALLRALLTTDPDDRITPSEVLKHPFITESDLNFQTDEVETSDETYSANAAMKIDLPDTYELLECLGKGCFGVVTKCQKVDTGQIVAIKFPLGRGDDNEVSMLRRIKSKIDKHDNIIEFIDSFPTRCGTALVFEQLDINLHEYLAKLDERLPLADIRSITKQIATALDVLKGIRVIHGDLHLGNIMMVNHLTQPLKVKLIDFGGSILRTEETLECIMQPLHIWSPEVALGLPFTEAIDMWALGCVLFEMLFGQRPVNGHCPYEIIRSIINIRGMPEDYLLDNSPLAEFYFNRTESNTWEFKTPAEFIRDSCMGDDNNCKIGESHKLVHVDFDDEYEPCLALLWALLTMDPDDRITPSEVLKHLFITESNLNFQTDEVETSDETCSANSPITIDLPDTYELLECLGKGGFGVVVKCQKVDTGQIVAIKFPLGQEDDNEVSMLRRIKSKIDKHDNIIEFIDSFPTRFGTALVFEQLDIDLHEYLANLDERLPLADIRSITKQIATALEALKGIQVIHGDLHLGNIMMINHQTQPLKVKLIDFGGSIPSTEETLERIVQPLHILSPEVALGLPFTEAIDMWALGCVLFEMLFGQRPFNGHCPYEIIRSIINIRGMPEDHLIDNSPLAEFYFYRTESNTWEFKTPAEFIRDSCMGDDNNCKIGESYKIVPVDFDDEYEPCLALLRALLTTDPGDRITPSEVLKHPFITESDLNFQTDEVETSGSSSFTSLNETSEREPPAMPLKDDASINVQPDDSTPAFHIFPSDVILVKPALAENTLELEDWDCAFRFQTDEVKVSVDILPSDEILVQPETAENAALHEDQESAVSFQSGLDKASESLISEESITHDLGTKQKKKKKNCIQQPLSWMRKTFLCCVDDDDD